MAELKVLLDPRLEKSFGKDTNRINRIVDKAIESGTIKVIRNRAGQEISILELKEVQSKIINLN